MRVTVAVLLSSLFVIAGSAFAEEPAGADLIAKFFEASGGQEKMAAVKGTVQTGTLMLTDMGMEATYKQTVAPPNSVMEMDFGGTVVKNGLTDGIAWSVNPFQGNSRNETQGEAKVFPSLDLAEAGEFAKNVGEEDVGGAACYKVEVPNPEGGTMAFWFDKETGLLSKVDDGSGQVTLLSEYKEADGLTVPHKINQTGGEFAIEIVLTKIEFDPEIEDGTFDIPAEVGE